MQNQPSSALEGFTQIYAGDPPWVIGRPKAPFIVVADQVTSPVLDAGCGPGDTAVFFAARGQQVTGIDFVEERGRPVVAAEPSEECVWKMRFAVIRRKG